MGSTTFKETLSAQWPQAILPAALQTDEKAPTVARKKSSSMKVCPYA